MEKIIEFLSKNRDVVLGTVWENKPKLRVFKIVRIEKDKAYFAVPRNSNVLETIKDDSSAEMLSMCNNEFVRAKGILLFYVPDNIAKEIYYYSFDLPKIYASYDMLQYFYLEIFELEYCNLNVVPAEYLHVLIK